MTLNNNANLRKCFLPGNVEKLILKLFIHKNNPGFLIVIKRK